MSLPPLTSVSPDAENAGPTLSGRQSAEPPQADLGLPPPMPSTAALPTLTHMPPAPPAASQQTVLLVDAAGDADDGDYSAGNLTIREALVVASVAGGDTRIVFDGSFLGQTITLSNGQLEVTDGTVVVDGDIDGDNRADVTISGGDQTRILKIVGLAGGPNPDLTLKSLILEHGRPDTADDRGGAVLNQRGTLTLQYVTAQANSAYKGGVVYADLGAVNIITSAITGNEGSYGAVVNGLSSQVSIVNSTLSGNTASTGSIIYMSGTGAGFTAINATITGNAADSTVRSDAGTVTIQNSAVAGNSVAWDLHAANASGVSAGHSVFGTVLAGVTDGADGNHIGITAEQLGLGPVTDNGGPVASAAFTDPASILIDGGDSALVPPGITLDAAGQSRNSGSATDIGATEYHGDHLPHLTTTAFTVSENTTFAGTIGASDADGDFVLVTPAGGADSHLFTYDLLTGDLAFSVPPDFENPADANHDNIYEIAFNISGQVTETVTVSVRDEPDLITVTTDKDIVDPNDGVTSLREAVNAANNGTSGGITFAASLSGRTLTLTQGGLNLTGFASINGDTDGDGRADLTISGGGQFRAFTLADSAHVDLSSVKITDCASSGNGGAILQGQTSVLNLSAVTISNSRANAGGAIFAIGESITTAEGSTFSGNTASTGGMFGGNGLGIRLKNCTVTGNSATNGSVIELPSGGIYIYNSTLSRNSGNATVQSGGFLNLAIRNSVLAGNSVGSDIAAAPGPGASVDIRNSVFGTAIGLARNGANGNLTAVPASALFLGALADNGGPVMTMNILSASSVLFEAGNNALIPNGLAHDANGKGRIVGPRVDIGAVEYINNPPVIAANGFNAFENGTAVGRVTATDAEGDSLQFSISGGPDGGRFTIDRSTGELSFTAPPDFENPASAGGGNSYRVDVAITDGAATVVGRVTVNVVNVDESGSGNRPPLIAATDFHVPENIRPAAVVPAADPEGNALTWSISGGEDAALFTIDAGTGLLIFRAPPDFEHPADQNGDNIYRIEVSVTDGSASDTRIVTVTVGDADEGDGNHPPLITATGFTVYENATAVTVIPATDPDRDRLDWSITGGADGALFAIDADTGKLSFIAPPDYENPASAGGGNSYVVEVRVSDGTDSDTKLITVTVADSDEGTSPGNKAPVITTTSFEIEENTRRVGMVTATDPDRDTLHWSITGGPDRALFTIDPDTGALAFAAPPDYEAPGDQGQDNIYDVQVTVSDGAHTASQTVSITVLNVVEGPSSSNHAPRITADAFHVDENSRRAGIVTAADADGDTLTWSITGGADAALFSIDRATGVLTFNAAPDYETPNDQGADNIYDLTVTVTDGGKSHSAAVTVTVDDVDEAAPNRAPLIGVTAFQIAENTRAVGTVTATDPEHDRLHWSITGGPDGVLFTIDPDTGALAFVAPPDYEAPADQGLDNQYRIEVTVSDGDKTDVKLVDVTVGNLDESTGAVNQPPVIIANAFRVDENTRAAGTVTAVDVDGGTLHWSISGGDDGRLFTIDPDSGQLVFRHAPDFEHPTDKDHDNEYQVEVTVTDGDRTDVDIVTVTVGDIAESGGGGGGAGGGGHGGGGGGHGGGGAGNQAPVVTPAIYKVPEGNAIAGRIDATDPDGDKLTYTIEPGGDGGLFTVDPGTGIIAFVKPPDFEHPHDRGHDNTYVVKVKVTDGTHETVQKLTVQVKNGPEPILVTTEKDVVDRHDGLTSLREAVNIANRHRGHDTIVFDECIDGRTIRLKDCAMTLTGKVTVDGDIDGDRKADVTVSGGREHRIFDVSGAQTKAVLESLTLTRGRDTDDCCHDRRGGAVLVGAGARLVIVDSTVSESRAGQGGGIFVAGSIVAANTLFLGNDAAHRGGGIGFGARSSGSLVNTTFYGNSAGETGGGIAMGAESLVTLAHATLIGNKACVDGGGVFAGSGGLSLFNSVVARNDALLWGDISGSTAALTASYSVFGSDVVGISGGRDGNLENVQHLGLGELLDNGGPTMTLSPLDRSVLLGQGLALLRDRFDLDHDGNRQEWLPFDGRDLPRLVGRGSDAGAAEHGIDETITGSKAANHMFGGRGADVLTGRAGDDLLNGGRGDDWLDGGRGHDRLKLGGGEDHAVLHRGGPDADTVYGFRSGVDHIVIRAAEFHGLLTASLFALDAAKEADDRLIYETATGRLLFDANGSAAGGGELIAVLHAHPALSAGDILIV